MEEVKKLNKHQINRNIHDHMNEISKEFRTGFETLKKYPKSVSIFGSSRSTPASPHYKQAQELANRIVKELNYSVITGGGPGIMAAANLGAKEADGNSIGFNIDLPYEQHTNPYTTSSIHFKYFFARKTILSFAAEAYVFFPGGYGTFDEFFNIITLIQTQKIPRVPIILIGKDFWTFLKDFMVDNMFNRHHTINSEDLELFTITDNLDKAIEIIKNTPVSRWWETNELG
jgi:uncharacterized protein (TIGR00730 family)